MAVQFEVPYKDKLNKLESGYVDIPLNASAFGNCTDKTKQEITLSWTFGNGTKQVTDNVTFTFDMKDKKYNLTQVIAFITPDEKNFPNINSKFDWQVLQKECNN